MGTRPNLQPEAVSSLVLIPGRAPFSFGPLKKRRDVASLHFQTGDLRRSLLCELTVDCF